MINQIVFRSAKDPNAHCYVVNRELGTYWNYTRGHGKWRFVDDHCGWFDTYNDGMVQHSPDLPVPTSRLADFCVSLAAHILEHPEHHELISKAFSSTFDTGAEQTWRKEIAFLSHLKYKEDKFYQFFSLDSEYHCKVSSHESKRHDKRWVPVPSDADGSCAVVWRLWHQHHNHLATSGLTAFHVYDMFTRMYRDAGGWVPHAERVEVMVGVDDQPHVSQAFEALRFAVTGVLAMRDAGRFVDCYTRNVQQTAEVSQLSVSQQQ